MSQILGHEKERKALDRLLATERLPATLLFHGLDGIGKKLIAQDFAQKLSSNEDIRTFAPEAKSGYLIETIKRIITEAMQNPYNAPCRILILDDAHKMLPAHANALLKTLEEPLPTTNFILITDQPQKLLPTICSRSFALKFQPLPNLPKLACGSLGRQKRLEQNDLYTRFLSWIMAPDFCASQEALATFEETELPDILHLYLLWIRDLEHLKLGGNNLHFDADLITPYKEQNYPSYEIALKQVEKVEDALLYNVKWQALLGALRETHSNAVNL
ncbi:MAG: AAA family ATPase [Candidatus Algichlamydia australiensis]|nr:AAA family ATPase [Chlamydiales bacterium]